MQEDISITRFSKVWYEIFKQVSLPGIHFLSMAYFRIHGIGLHWTGLDWTGLDQVGLDCIELDLNC